MLCSDTGETQSVHVEGMSVADAQEISNALTAVRTVGHGNGEVCIPLVNGLFNKIKIAMTSYRDQHKQRKRMVH